MSLPRYPDYADSKSDITRMRPVGWADSRIMRLAGPVTERADKSPWKVALQNVEGWTGRFVETDVVLEGEGIAFSTGDVLFGKLRPYLAKALAAPRSGAAVGDFLVLRPNPGVEPNFLRYLLTSPAIIDRLSATAEGAKMPRTSWEELSSLVVACPTELEQRAVAAFLGRETAKIDTLIAQQDRLIALLQEKRQAVISHAVTKGLNPNAPMKESGVTWLGAIPAHWQLNAIGRLAGHIGSGKTPRGGSETYVESGILFLRSQNVYNDGLRLNDVAFIDEETDNEMSGSRVRPRDILLNITGASLGRSCTAPDDLPPANVNQHVCIVRMSNPEQADYVSLFMNCEFAKRWWDYVQTGAAREGLNHSQVARTPIPLPPSGEQRTILSSVRTTVSRLAEAARAAEQAISLLRERRTALVTAAVTGQIDVRRLVESAA